MPASQSLPFLGLSIQTRKSALSELLFLLRRNICSLKHARKGNACFAVAPFSWALDTDSQIRSFRASFSASQKYLLVEACPKRKCLLRSRSLFLGMLHYITFPIIGQTTRASQFQNKRLRNTFLFPLIFFATVFLY